jgi:23S rRNA (adenine2503-C2)-methyltransferase
MKCGMTALETAPSVPPVLASLHGFTRPELAGVCRELGQPAYRADQIWEWLYVHGCADWAAMKNLPAALRTELGARFTLQPLVLRETQGVAGETRKLLVALADGESVEVVLIPGGPRRTVCVSSQVGCRYHCAFCASGQAGFRRHMQSGELVGQALLAAQVYQARPTHVVFMGIGEPLDNYENVLKAIRILNDPAGLAIGARRITISTCGLVPGIARLAGEGLQVELSVSLHAPSDALRSALMPVNRAYPLAGLMAACKAYAVATKRIITFEYTLIRGRNDAPSEARELVRRISDVPCRVNLIPLSAVEEFPGEASVPETARMFLDVLNRAGINATLRASKGVSLRAACGQLRCRRRSPPSP